MQSFGEHYRALVIGASGSIGQAFVQALRSDPHCAEVVELSRSSQPALDLTEPDSIERAAQQLKAQAPFQLIIHAAGILHRDALQPEKSLSKLNNQTMQTVFQINALGPARVLQQFVPLLSRDGAMAFLSAKVGSIGDNRLGGWYSYRASKAALNMLIKTAAIEVARTRPQVRLLSLHPGTVISPLSAPFQGGAHARPASVAAQEMLRVIDQSTAADSGSFFAYNGERLPW